ncbi:L-glutaminase [Roseivirga ehrenbergii]|uniref:Glutaminase n=1 Tax=Roseivirga ehrenbergii (strain DSM 102268 / JCM 13514 / KCTC 12282 / NCIMB 14502 / KMM 6017) TaxID=279360 RepID=A0A150XE68_ROSEK|nr:glutaminase [Roseivirga ehrenbergii]KYG76998.1 glutaminase A [Roseivirga ehrenbergii]TCL14502.1 L-glutaminase [Roseivirga ehrenbergii]
MEYKQAFSNTCDFLSKINDPGKVASYIPELGSVDPNKFGVHLTTINGESFSHGDFDEKFSIQSIAKVLSLVLAYELEGEKLWKRVGVEPSGTAFNSLVQLEHDKGIPRNPLINSGALVVCDILVDHLKNSKQTFIEYIRKVADNDSINYNEKVAQSEKEHGYRNAALINLMKAYGNIDGNCDEVLDFYFHLCAIEMTCAELSRTFMFLVNDGIDPFTKEKIISTEKSKRINTLMQLCGFYDEAGEFSFKVGIPGKSGVGGGIIAVLPEHFSVAVWSPPLNEKGNSYKGMRFLEMFNQATDSSVF